MGQPLGQPLLASPAAFPKTIPARGGGIVQEHGTNSRSFAAFAGCAAGAATQKPSNCRIEITIGRARLVLAVHTDPELDIAS